MFTVQSVDRLNATTTSALSRPFLALLPASCFCGELGCPQCALSAEWHWHYTAEVNDILSKSNIHDCTRGLNADCTVNKKKFASSCLNNVFKKCKAQFPRPTYLQSFADPDSGALLLKKLEPWMNDVCPMLSYLFRSNTDVTCLLSGTAIKAVVVYVSDYITKCSLKTHVVFDVIRSVFEKNTELLDRPITSFEKARTLMIKMVNLLSTKMELGTPMISHYLLD